MQLLTFGPALFSFENSIAVMMALGGSTNGVLHLLALAREAGVELDIDMFNIIGNEVPFLGNLQPAGKYGFPLSTLTSGHQQPHPTPWPGM